MAITRVGNITSSSFGTGVTSLTVDAPTGTQEGDLLVAWLYTGNQTVNSTGWTTLVTSQAGSAGFRGTVMYRFLPSGSPPSTYDFTTPFAVSSSCHISAWRGVDPVTPFAGSGITGANTPGSPFTTPTISMDAADQNRLLYFMGGTIGDGTEVTWITTAGGVTDMANFGVNLTGPTAMGQAGWNRTADTGWSASETGIPCFPSTNLTAGVGATVALRAAVDPVLEAVMVAEAPLADGLMAGGVFFTPEGEMTAEAPLAMGAFTGEAEIPERSRRAEYEVFIDWDNDGGLNEGNFEATTEGWEPRGNAPALLSSTDLRSFSGTRSLRVDWQEVITPPFADNPQDPFQFDEDGFGFDQGQFAESKNLTEEDFVQPYIVKERDFVVGNEYQLRAQLWVPVGQPLPFLGVVGVGRVQAADRLNEWQEVIFKFTATQTTHEMAIWHNVDDFGPETAGLLFVDQVMVTHPNEDVTCDVLNRRQRLAFKHGRDIARALSAIAPGKVRLEADNRDRKYTPENPGSVLAGLLGPGREVLIRANWEGRSYNLFHGYLDDYELIPDLERRSVDFGAVDLLAKLSDSKIFTELYPSLQTGEAIHVVLDEIGWPQELRDIDHGATTVTWWFEEDTSALDAVTRLMYAEGTPAIMYVDTSNNFVFRDRHHRLLDERSTEVQAIFRCDPTFDEPVFAKELKYNLGWKDVINDIDVQVEERRPEDPQVVWSSDNVIVLTPSSSTVIHVHPTDPFINAQVPVQGAGPSPDNHDGDFWVEHGGSVVVGLSKTSGGSTAINLTSITGATIHGLQLRAQPVPVAIVRKVLRQDTDSVALHGRKSNPNPPTVGTFNDVDAVSTGILIQRAERLPTVEITVNNGNPIRMHEILNRELSDRIHLVEMDQTMMDDGFFIESIEHRIGENGASHITKFGCERAVDIPDEFVPDPVENPFTFDVDGAGWDDGYFASLGGGELSPLLQPFQFDNPDAGFENGHFTGGESGTVGSSGGLFILGTSRLGQDGLGL